MTRARQHSSVRMSREKGWRHGFRRDGGLNGRRHGFRWREGCKSLSELCGRVDLRGDGIVGCAVRSDIAHLDLDPVAPLPSAIGLHPDPVGIRGIAAVIGDTIEASYRVALEGGW